MTSVDDPTLDATVARCVIFFYEGYVGVQPTVVNLAKAMGRAGYAVTVYAAPTWASNVGELDAGVRIEYLRPRPLLDKLGALGFGRYRLRRVVARLIPEEAAFALRAGYLEIKGRRRDSRRTVYVGVDSNGAAAALLSATLLRRGYVFLSLELKLLARLRSGLRGRFARLAYRRAECVIVQGLDRLDVLTRELRWKHTNVFVLPNSPFAAVEERSPEPGTFNMRTNLKIGPTKRIALQAGMINDNTCSRQLAQGFAGLSDWALVLHERQKRSADEPYFKRLRNINSDSLVLSLDPVPYDQIDRVFAAADVGLTFYQPSSPADDNFRLVSSSGKLPHYLKHGKPVLVSNLPSLAEVIEEFECGFVIKDPSSREEIGSALEKVLSRYADLSRNATRCFAERYDFGKSAVPLIRFMDRL